MKQVGRKDDAGKIRQSLLPNLAFFAEMLEIMEYGAKHYGERNYLHVKKVRYEDALFRHYIAYRRGELADKDTNKSHLAHIAVNAMFISIIEARLAKKRRK